MGEAIGAKTIDLEWVQVHPTGLVNPKDPDAKVKFLAAEALRGVGGLIFDDDGYRFANELGRRDYVTGEMWKNKGPFRLCLNAVLNPKITQTLARLQLLVLPPLFLYIHSACPGLLPRTMNQNNLSLRY